MENLDLLRTLIKKYGGNTPKPDKKELYKTILNYYCEREPMTNDEKEYLGSIAWEMINNFYQEK